MQDSTPSPENVAQPYDVVDGTTIYYNTDGEVNNDDTIQPTATFSDVKSTASVRHQSSKTEDVPVTNLSAHKKAEETGSSKEPSIETSADNINANKAEALSFKNLSAVTKVENTGSSKDPSLGIEDVKMNKTLDEVQDIEFVEASKETIKDSKEIEGSAGKILNYISDWMSGGSETEAEDKSKEYVEDGSGVKENKEEEYIQENVIQKQEGKDSLESVRESNKATGFLEDEEDVDDYGDDDEDDEEFSLFEDGEDDYKEEEFEADASPSEVSEASHVKQSELGSTINSSPEDTKEKELKLKNAELPGQVPNLSSPLEPTVSEDVDLSHNTVPMLDDAASISLTDSKMTHDDTSQKTENPTKSNLELNKLKTENEAQPLQEVDTTKFSDGQSIISHQEKILVDILLNEESEKVNVSNEILLDDVSDETANFVNKTEESEEGKAISSEDSSYVDNKDAIDGKTAETNKEETISDIVEESFDAINKTDTEEINSLVVPTNTEKVVELNAFSTESLSSDFSTLPEPSLAMDLIEENTLNPREQTVTEIPSNEPDSDVPTESGPVFNDIAEMESPTEATTKADEITTELEDLGGSSINADSEEELEESSGGFFTGILDFFQSGVESVVNLVSTTSETTTEENSGIEVKYVDDGLGGVESARENVAIAPEDEGTEKVDDKALLQRERQDATWSSLWNRPGNEAGTKDSGAKHETTITTDAKDVGEAAVCLTDSGAETYCSGKAGSVPLFEKNIQTADKPLMGQDGLEIQHGQDEYLAEPPGSMENVDIDLSPTSYNAILFTTITGIFVLLLTLGYYYIEKMKLNQSLVAELNKLQKALHVKSIERQSSLDESSGHEVHTQDFGTEVIALQEELEDVKTSRMELEEKVSVLEKELEGATEAGLELNKMLGDLLSSQQGSDQLVRNMEELQKQLDTQEATMKANLADKSAELNLSLQEKEEKEEELLRNSEIIQTQIKEALDGKAAEVLKLSQDVECLQLTLEEVKQALAIRDSEVTVLQDCLKQLRSSDDEMEGVDRFQALLDVGRVRAELKMAVVERDSLAERLQGEEDARRLLEDHVKIVTKEVEKLRIDYEEAEKEKLESQTRLEVLSNYFKQKETQLQKELGLQEAMNIQKDDNFVSTFERIKHLQDEVENYNGEVSSSTTSLNTADGHLSPKKKKKIKVKRLRQNYGSQVDTLKKEIIDQERGLKSQLSTFEKKSHENWVAARQAERRLEEARQEAGQLRNRLTIVEKNITNTPNGDTSLKLNDNKHFSGLVSESNGELLVDLPVSPPLPQHFQRDGLPLSPLPFMPPPHFLGMPPPFLPPPPGMPFLPPPPPPLFPGDRRPPPLGRMSSPPLRYSPPPRGGYSPTYDTEDQSPPPSPPGRSYRSPPRFTDPDSYRERSPPPHLRWHEPVGHHRSSGFRPLPPPVRNSPREPRGSAVSSGHSSESLEKSSRHSENMHV
uniref:Transport and Golgi organization protein 1 n=1 Tax=Timema bartmani TaxID=61472 RepID=A0A7R9EN54_9NEOP|nr:unnamed protein product [Timema bartmani]